MRFEQDIPKILDAILAATKINVSQGYTYNDVEDIFNDWFMPFVETLPFDSWISAITNSVQTDMVCEAMAKDERFKQYLRGQ